MERTRLSEGQDRSSTLRPNSTETLVQVDAPHFCAGIVLVDDVCTEAAPILKWAVGKHRDWLRDYFKAKGWKATVCKPWTPSTKS